MRHPLLAGWVADSCLSELVSKAGGKIAPLGASSEQAPEQLALEVGTLLEEEPDSVSVNEVLGKIPTPVESFDWKVYGSPDASQLSWGDSPSANVDDLRSDDLEAAFFVNKVEVWRKEPSL
jgi:hypothetical protein